MKSGSERERTGQVREHPHVRGQLAGAHAQPARGIETAFGRQLLRPARQSPCRHRLDLERERHREVLLQRRSLEQHAARRHDAESFEQVEPRIAVRDVGGPLAEDADLP